MRTYNRMMSLAALLLFLQCSRTSQALHLVMYNFERQDTGPMWHDLNAVRNSLERAGHTVGRPKKQSLHHAAGSVCMIPLRHTVVWLGKIWLYLQFTYVLVGVKLLCVWFGAII